MEIIEQFQLLVMKFTDVLSIFTKIIPRFHDFGKGTLPFFAFCWTSHLPGLEKEELVLVLPKEDGLIQQNGGMPRPLSEHLSCLAMMQSSLKARAWFYTHAICLDELMGVVWYPDNPSNLDIYLQKIGNRPDGSRGLIGDIGRFSEAQLPAMIHDWYASGRLNTYNLPDDTGRIVSKEELEQLQLQLRLNNRLAKKTPPTVC